MSGTHTKPLAVSQDEEAFVDRVAVVVLKEMIKPETGLTETQVMNCPKAAYGLALEMLRIKREVNPERIR